MKHDEFADEEHQLIKQIESEYQHFKCRVLSKSKTEIYDNCNVIRFYHCIYEYFLYSENINKSHIATCLKYDNIIATLYALYLDNEYLKYDRWEDIEEILNVLLGKLKLTSTHE